MAVKDKIISFWKQVKLKSSDMFTQFRVGIGVKVPTHKLHIKDSKDPLKIEGLQKDTTDPDKYLTIDSSNIIKYRTGTEVASDIGAVSSFILEDGDGTEVTITNGSEIKFVEGAGVDIDWTDTSHGSDTDPYDLTFTVDHDAITNFVAAEHYRWDNDISSTATIHTNNITDLHGAGVDGSANQLLTDDGDGSVTSESTLTYASNSLTIGDTDGGIVTLTIPAHDNGNGSPLIIQAGNATAGQTDKSGGMLSLYAGRGTGDGDGSAIKFYTATAQGSTGTSLMSNVLAATITNDSKLRLDGGTLQGPADGDLLIVSDGNMTFRIDEDNDETSQSFAWQNNASTEIANLDESGNLQIDGDLTVSGGDISGPTDADLVLTSDGDITITIDADGDETDSIVLFRSRTVEIGRIDEVGNATFPGIITGKQRQIYQQSFLDDLGTTKHYLPWRDTDEQTTIYQEEAAMIAPYDGRIVSVTMRCSALSGSGNRTIGIHTFGPNASQFSSGSWTEEETESNAIEATDDNHVFYFVFDNAKHFESGELVVLSIQDDTDLTTGSRYTYVSTVVEWDYNNGLGTGASSAEYDSAQ